MAEHTDEIDKALTRDAVPLAGPWVIEWRDGYAEVLSADPYVHHVAVIYSTDGPVWAPAMRATARLIAAAPDLLAAAQQAEDLLHRCNPEMIEAHEIPATDAEWDEAHIALRAAIAKATQSERGR